MDEILDVLGECAEYLDAYADYTVDASGRTEPNRAARLLYDVQRLLNRVEQEGN